MISHARATGTASLPMMIFATPTFMQSPAASHAENFSPHMSYMSQPPGCRNVVSVSAAIASTTKWASISVRRYYAERRRAYRRQHIDDGRAQHEHEQLPLMGCREADISLLSAMIFRHDYAYYDITLFHAQDCHAASPASVVIAAGAAPPSAPAYYWGPLACHDWRSARAAATTRGAIS